MEAIRMIDIAAKNGRSHGFERRQVHALWYSGVWAVTRVIEDCGLESDVHFTVTHVPSGCNIGSACRRLSEDRALRILDAFGSEFPDWHSNAQFGSTNIPNTDPGRLINERGLLGRLGDDA